jgi:serine/threonine-protein kinase
MTPDSPDTGSLSLAALQHVERVCTRFEAAWRSGGRPRLEDYLTEEAGAASTALFRELLRLELELRQESGEALERHGYAERFPGRGEVIDAVFQEFADVSPRRGRLGRYALVRAHARGGLGEVLLARDQELPRVVAVKRLQERFAGHPDSQRRFLLEAEITARLEHPGVVPVHGMVSDDRGQTCYAMRFVQGETLQDAIRRFHSSPVNLDAATQPADIAARAGAGTPDNGRGPDFASLDFRRLLQCLIAVCNTIAYAHSRGIVHRDIKPANIMLGQYGETLVLDWGLAKDLSRPAQAAAADTQPPGATADDTPDATQLGAVLGTPEYMSPEQAGGRWDVLDHHSDVYSLGATLYHLLTGRPPFAGYDNFPALRAHIERGQFPRPREVQGRVPAALDAVCLKAMATEPRDRYASAADLARDLERWLGDEPVSVGAEPWAVRLGRWGRRHRAFVTGALVLLVTAAAALALSTLLINRQRLKAVESRKLAEANHLKAEANYQMARDAVERYFTQISENRLLNEPGMEPLRRDLFAAAREFHERFVRERGDDPGARDELAKAYLRLGQITGEIESVPRGIEYLTQARDLLRALAGEAPFDAEGQYNLGRSLLDLGTLLRKSGENEKARAALEEARDTLEPLSRAHGRENYKNDLGLTYFHLGALYLFDNRLAPAREFFDKGRDVFEGLARRHPEKVGYQNHLAAFANAVGASEYRAGNMAEAEKAYLQALAIRQRIVADEPGVKEYRNLLAQLQGNLGQLYTNTRRYAQAAKAYDQALETWDWLVNDNPTVAKYRESMATAYMNLGVLHLTREAYAESLPVYDKALALWEELAEKHPTVPEYRGSLARTLQNLAVAYEQLGRRPEVIAALERAAALSEGLDRQHPNTPRYLRDLGGMLRSLAVVTSHAGDLRGARAHYERALATYERLREQPPVNVAALIEFGETVGLFGNLCREMGDLDVALAQYDRALAILQPIYEKEPRNPAVQKRLVATHYGRALALTQQGRPRDRASDWDQAMAIAEEPRKTALQIERDAAWGNDLAAVLARADAAAEQHADSGHVLYAAAVAHAAAFARDPEERRKRHLLRVAELLKRARAAGHFRTREMGEELRRDFRFQTLWGREDFRDLLKEQDGQPGPPA